MESLIFLDFPVVTTRIKIKGACYFDVASGPLQCHISGCGEAVF